MAKRGMSVEKQKCWIDAILKEDRLRLKWFKRNEDKLVRGVEQPLSRTVPQELKDEMREKRTENYSNAERFANKRIGDPPPALVDERAIYNTMKPVDPATRKLLYTGTQKDGRINYLNARVKVLPEDRYYFTECSSYEYGWKMWNHAKTRVNLGHGRQQIVKNSFYRRRGVNRDPDWYREPAGLSPTVCGGCGG